MQSEFVLQLLRTGRSAFLGLFAVEHALAILRQSRWLVIASDSRQLDRNRSAFSAPVICLSNFPEAGLGEQAAPNPRFQLVVRSNMKTKLAFGIALGLVVWTILPATGTDQSAIS